MADERSATAMIQEIEFAPDSPLEGSGFELSVPRQMGNGFEALSETGPIGYRRRVSSEQLLASPNTPTKRSWTDSGVPALSSRPLVDSNSVTFMSR